MSTRSSSSKPQGISTTVFVITLIILVVVGVFAAFCFFQLNKCIADRLNNQCPTINTNTVD